MVSTNNVSKGFDSISYHLSADKMESQRLRNRRDFEWVKGNVCINKVIQIFLSGILKIFHMLSISKRENVGNGLS